MGKAEYDWEIGHPAILEPHSLAKHTILRRYVEEYIKILTSDRRVPEFRLALIDGFAGGGEYILRGEQRLHDGSPFILIDAVQAAISSIKIEREAEGSKPPVIDASFVFVEKKTSNYVYLKDALDRRLDKETRAKVTDIKGSFEDHVDKIIYDIKSVRGRKPRPIFVLDQYGYSDIPIERISRIMHELPRAEIFLTLAYDWIGAYARGAAAQALRVNSSLHIAPHLESFADGTRGIEEIEALPPNDRIAAKRYIQQMLHEGFARQGGAKCYTPFFITSGSSHRDYWFLHLANSTRANDVVKNLHWTVKNHFCHYGRAGLMMLGYNPARPEDDTQQSAFSFNKSAWEQTVEALLEELPARIQAEFPDGVSYDSLYALICNETPASKLILGEAITKLSDAGELETLTPKERIRRVDKIEDDDIIRVSKQPRLYSIGRPHPKRRP